MVTDDFTFSLSDIEYIIGNTGNIVPGIRKVMSVFFSEKKRQPEAVVVNEPFDAGRFEEFPMDENALLQMKKLREQDISYFWYSMGDIPFSAETEKIVQFDSSMSKKKAASKDTKKTAKANNDITSDLFDENERHILMITVKNELDGKNDLIFYYFNKNLSNFKLSLTDASLDQKNKTIIGMMLFNAINFIAQTCRSDRQALRSYNQGVRTIVSTLKKAAAENKDINVSYYNAVVNYVNELLQDFSRKSDRYAFELSESARIKLKEYHGDFKLLNKIIKAAAGVARKMAEGLAGRTIVIEDYHLEFNEYSKAEVKPSVSMDESKYNKTILLLDRLEDAAQKVIQKKIPLTGYNVGQECIPHISAAGISDALSKHGKRIKTVMNTHKERWPIIRNEFRPLINVLTSRAYDEESLSRQA